MGYHVIRSENYDWIALYHDGILLHQDHSIQEEDMLELLGVEFEHEIASQAQFDAWGGLAPETL